MGARSSCSLGCTLLLCAMREWGRSAVSDIPLKLYNNAIPLLSAHRLWSPQVAGFVY